MIFLGLKFNEKQEQKIAIAGHCLLPLPWHPAKYGLPGGLETTEEIGALNTEGHAGEVLTSAAWWPFYSTAVPKR